MSYAAHLFCIQRRTVYLGRPAPRSQLSVRQGDVSRSLYTNLCVCDACDARPALHFSSRTQHTTGSFLGPHRCICFAVHIRATCPHDFSVGRISFRDLASLEQCHFAGLPFYVALMECAIDSDPLELLLTQWEKIWCTTAVAVYTL